MWRSASRSGDIKTPKSKRGLTLPKRTLVALDDLFGDDSTTADQA